VLIVLKFGKNILAPSGPVQACNGIALPIPFTADGEDNEDKGYTAEKLASVVTVPRHI